MTIQQAQREGTNWAKANPGATPADREARRIKFAEAWGESYAQQFWYAAKAAA